MSAYRLPRRPILAVLVLCATLAGQALLAPRPAHADGPFPAMLSEADRQRLDSHDEALRAALDFARSHAPADVRRALDLMSLPAAPLAPADMAGDWRCRLLLMSRDVDLPLIVYPYFRCRISDDGAGLRLDKLTGSQRTAGTFYDVGQARLGYAGALALGDEARRPRYGDIAGRDQVGYLVPLSPGHLRLELPGPAGSGRFEVLELRR